MSIDLLKALIEAACADGAVTDEQLLHLHKKAEEFGVSADDLTFLIQGELEHVKSQLAWHNQEHSNSSGIGSGFITQPEQSDQNGQDSCRQYMRQFV